MPTEFGELTDVLLRSIGIIMLAFVVSACSEPPYTNLDNEQLKTLIDQGVPLYDIRRADEWRQTGVIEGSRLLTFADGGGRLKPGFLDRFTEQTDSAEPVILICHTGYRTDLLGRYLVEQLGYTQVYNVRRGISDWIRDGGTVTRFGPTSATNIPPAGATL